MSPNNQRLRIKNIEVIPEADDRQRVRITLTGKDREYVGERSGGRDENERLATAAQAVLDAITSALVKPVTLTLKGINGNEVFEGFSESLMIVAIIFNDGNSEMVMPGSCRITGDKIEATVKATLDATNRVTELYI